MLVAITGGTGFIGKKLVTRLIERGDTVRLLTRHSWATGEKSSFVETHECDLLTAGIDELSAMLDGVDVLYHCAGQLNDTNTMRPLHVDATRKLTEAASERVGHWVQLSSVGVGTARRSRSAYASMAAAQFRNFINGQGLRWAFAALLSTLKAFIRSSPDRRISRK